MNWQIWAAAGVVALLSYLIGSVSFAVIVSRVGMQEDVRNYGSGNAGMTNILRNYGKGMAAFTAIGDFGKGVVAVALGRLIFPLIAGTAVTGTVPIFLDAGYVAGLFVILGHLFPIYFGFRGGKGVLTSLGVVLMLNPMVFLLLLVLLLPVVFTVKIVSFTVLIGYVLFPLFTLAVDYFQGGPMLSDFIFALLISGMGAFMHRTNIQRLRAGTEYRFGQKRSDSGESVEK